MEDDRSHPAPAPEWNRAEQWAWQRIREGNIADFNELLGPLLPRQPEGWTSERELRSRFIEQVLLDDAYRNALPHQGVRIIGAWIREPLLLHNARIAHEVWLDKTRFEGNVSFASARCTSTLSFAESFFGGTFSMIDARIDVRLILRAAKFVHAVDLRSIDVNSDISLGEAELASLNMNGARVRGDGDLRGLQCDEVINMEGADVVGDVFLSKCDVSEANLTGSKIGGQLSMIEAHCSGSLCMQGLRIGADLFMDRSTLVDVDLTGAEVAAQLVLNNARSSGKIEMQGMNVGADLFMRDANMLAEVNLIEAKITGRLELSKSCFADTLHLSGIGIGRNLMMDDVRCSRRVSLTGAQISGTVDMEAARLNDELEMSRIRIDANLRMGSHAIFDSVHLINARVGGYVDLLGSTCKSMLSMNGLEVGRYLLMNKGARFAGVELRGAHVRGRMEIVDAVISETLDMDGLEVGRHLLLRRSACFADTYMRDGHVGGDLDVSGSAFAASVNLGGSTIDGSLCLGSAAAGTPAWGQNSELALHNTKVAMVQDHPHTPSEDCWPPRVSFDGFAYSRLGGDGVVGGDDLGKRGVAWFVRWLQKDAQFRPDSYAHLSRVLLQQGYPEKANAIVYAGRERDRQSASGLRWLGLGLLKITIGYGIGYRYFRSLAWVALFAVIGFAVFRTIDPPPLRDPLTLFLFSVDQLLPVVKFLPGSDDIAKKIGGWQQDYLVVHRAAGFLLSSFVVAGLAGITKK